MTACRVELAPEGRSFTARPGESVLGAAHRAGVLLPHACRSGNCGTCLARLVAGEVHYPRGRPNALLDLAADGVLLCQAEPLTDLVVEVRTMAEAGRAEVKQLPCRVARTERASPDVLRVWLALPAVETLQFRAGQYIDILLPDGRRKSFSLACPPHDAGLLELHLRRGSDGGFTAGAFTSLTAGTLLRIEGPLGVFGYQDAAAGSGTLILVAGGTGFAPVKAILRHVLEGSARRPVHLYFGARAAVDLYEDAWLRELARSQPRLRYVPVLSEPAPGEAHRHRVGLVHEAVRDEAGHLDGAEVYAAGPPPMVVALRTELAALGLPAARFYCDDFAAAYQPAGTAAGVRA